MITSFPPEPLDMPPPDTVEEVQTQHPTTFKIVETLRCCHESTTKERQPAVAIETRLKRHNTQESGYDSDATSTTDTSDDGILPSTIQMKTKRKTSTSGHEVNAVVETIKVQTVPSSKLFIGGLSSATTESDLREHFAAFGCISEVEVIRHSVTCKSRGFGFLTFSSEESAASVVHRFQQTKTNNDSIRVIKDRTVDVRIALPRQGDHSVHDIKRNQTRHGRSEMKSIVPQTSAIGSCTTSRPRAASCDGIMNSCSPNRTSRFNCSNDTDDDNDVANETSEYLTVVLHDNDDDDDVDVENDGNNDGRTSERSQLPPTTAVQHRPSLRQKYVSMPDESASTTTTTTTTTTVMVNDECEWPNSPHGMRWRAMSESVLQSPTTVTVDSQCSFREHEPLLTIKSDDNNSSGSRRNTCTKRRSHAGTVTSLVSKNVHKVFVGGLSPLVRTKDLRVYFSKFGLVKDAVVMFDRKSNRSRGFGFVAFADASAAAEVCSPACAPFTHELLGKWIEVKAAESRETMASQASSVSLASTTTGANTLSSTSPDSARHYQKQQLQRKLELLDMDDEDRYGASQDCRDVSTRIRTNSAERAQTKKELGASRRRRPCHNQQQQYQLVPMSDPQGTHWYNHQYPANTNMHMHMNTHVPQYAYMHPSYHQHAQPHPHCQQQHYQHTHMHPYDYYYYYYHYHPQQQLTHMQPPPSPPTTMMTHHIPAYVPQTPNVGVTAEAATDSAGQPSCHQEL